MSDDLVERLRAPWSWFSKRDDGTHGPNNLAGEAADHIEELEASLQEMRRMREAAVRGAEKAEAENARLQEALVWASAVVYRVADEEEVDPNTLAVAITKLDTLQEGD